MADTLDLNINIGANVNNLDAAMQKAQNLLGQFQSALKKATSVGEINYLNTQIENLNGTIKNISGQMGNMAKPTGDATQALTNLSRIAQDAPYGFMGIANNLNPMLESFQQLSKKSDGAGNALKAMVAGLTGPAGIGLALGVVSSLIVKYGDEIGDMIVKTTDFEKAQEGIRNAFFDSLKSVEATIATDEALVSVINDVTQSTEARKAALTQLKETHKGNVELQKTDIEDGVALIKIIDQLSEALIRKAKIEATAKIIGEENAKLVRLEMSTIQEQVGNLSGLAKTWDVLSGSVKGALGGTGALGIGLNLVNDGLKNNEKQVSSTKESIEKLKESLKSLTAEAYKAGDFDVVGKGGKGETESPYTKALKSFQASLSAEDTLLKNNLQSTQQNLDNKIKIYEDFIKKLGGINNEQAKAKIAELMTPLGEMQMSKLDQRIKDAGKFIDNQKGDVLTEKEATGGSNRIVTNLLTGETREKESDKQFDLGKKSMDSFFKDNKKKFDEAEKAAKSYAETISQSVTGGIMNLWDAMEKGENPLQALSNMFKDLLKELAAAVIQATLFQAIMALINPAGAATGGGGGGLIGGIGKIFGFAEGGIVSQPTLSMVGEGGQSEAIMPLNKLGNMMNSTFNAGAMSGQGGGGNGQFVLKGNDLVLAMQRSNFSLNVRR